MKQNSLAEILLSGAVILVGLGFIWFIYTSTSGPTLSGYDLSVELSHAYGLKSGSDVDINGIKVGSISDMTLNHTTATIHFTIRNDIQLPKDSVARAASGGMLDPSNVLTIQPGRARDVLPPGGQMTPQL